MILLLFSKFFSVVKKVQHICNQVQNLRLVGPFLVYSLLNSKFLLLTLMFVCWHIFLVTKDPLLFFRNKGQWRIQRGVRGWGLGVRVNLFMTKLFQFHGEFSEKSGKINK